MQRLILSFFAQRVKWASSHILSRQNRRRNRLQYRYPQFLNAFELPLLITILLTILSH